MNFEAYIKDNAIDLSNRRKIKINMVELVTFLQSNTSVTKLIIRNSSIDDQDIKILVKGNLSHLTFCDLNAGSISCKGAMYLANSNLCNLTYLDLSSNVIDDQGAMSLANGNLSKLTYLNLYNNCINYKGVIALASGNLSNLTSLNLNGNKIGYQGVEALANGNLFNLNHLDISRNRINDCDIETLSKSNNLSNLTSIALYKNTNISSRSIRALTSFSNLTSIDFRFNYLGYYGAKALSESNLLKLTSLDLMSTSIGNRGIEALANSNLFRLSKLGLGYNEIDNQGAEALAKGNLFKLTSLNLIHNKIDHRGVQDLAKGNLPNLTHLDLEYNKISYQDVKILAESDKIRLDLKIKWGYLDNFYCLIKQAWSENSNYNRLNQNNVKSLFFKLAQQNNTRVEEFEILLSDSDKYPFLINSINESGNRVSDFYTHSPDMQKFFFELGMVPESERNMKRENAIIARDSQSVHASPVVKRINFFAKRLVESINADKEEIEKSVTSYIQSIKKFQQYDFIKTRLLNLTDQEKRNVMENTLTTMPNDEDFIKTVLVQVKHILKTEYLRKKISGDYDLGYPSHELQYDYTKDDAKITIPQSIGLIKLFIDGLSFSIEEKKELLVTFIVQNPNLVENKLNYIEKELGEPIKLTKAELHRLLRRIDCSKKVDRLFKEISGLNITEVLKEQKEFTLLKQIYISATTYGIGRSACIHGVWTQIMSSIDEISPEIVEQYDNYLEKELMKEVQKPVITPENIKFFTEDLTNKLINRGEDSLDFKEVLEDFASCNVTLSVPETISFKQEKVLAEINRYFTSNIKRFLPNYEKSIPSFNEYEMIIYSLSERIRTRLEEEYQPRTSHTDVSIVNLAKSRSL